MPGAFPGDSFGIRVLELGALPGGDGGGVLAAGVEGEGRDGHAAQVPLRFMAQTELVGCDVEVRERLRHHEEPGALS